MHNNAGIARSGNSNMLENERSDFEHVIRTNLIGAFLGIKHVARVMIPNHSGSIITTASVCSTIGGAVSHAYVSSKHALIGLTRNTVVDLGRYGIRINRVSPYHVETLLSKEFVKKHKGGTEIEVYSCLHAAKLEAEDIADAALYLASDDPKYVSGHNLVVDGGVTVMNPAISVFENK